MLRRFGLIAFLALLMIVAAGCSTLENPQPVDPKTGGFWDRYLVYPMVWMLDESAKLLFGSYGLAILVVTIIVRLLLLPLMVKQLKNSKIMQALQPEMQKIREKYQNNQQKMQEEMMKLFQKHNVNPLAGCFPLLVQMPILIAFYQAIIRDEAIRNHTFLWMNLGDPDPYYVLPALAALTTFIQQKMMGINFNANPQAKMMLYIMPLMILVIAVSLPSALSLYWVYGNLFTIVQSYFLYKDSRQLQVQGGKGK
ncbi:YidC family membrane integrase SpoIIIJ [Bacillaceae bacterium]